MVSTRPQRVARVIKEEMSRIMREEMNDPRVGFVSITQVEVSSDLRMANIYVSVYGTPEEQQQSIEVLERATGFLRSLLGKALEMRYIPAIQFHLDHSLEHGAHIFELLKQVEQTTPVKEKGTEDEQS